MTASNNLITCLFSCLTTNYPILSFNHILLLLKSEIRNVLDEFFSKISWRKLDRKNTLISEGGKILNHDYDKKATVTVDTTGSTLLLAPVEHVDAGMYQCY